MRAQIGLLATLKELYVSFNELTRLPPEIGRCETLERLVASNNSLEELPHELGKCSKLKVLDVNTNKLRVHSQYSLCLLFFFFFFLLLDCNTKILIGLQVIPPDTADIEGLEKIDISCNPLIPQIDSAAKKGQKKLIEYLKSDDYDSTYYKYFTFFAASFHSLSSSKGEEEIINGVFFCVL